jgi:hypothetical protein
MFDFFAVTGSVLDPSSVPTWLSEDERRAHPYYTIGRACEHYSTQFVTREDLGNFEDPVSPEDIESFEAFKANGVLRRKLANQQRKQQGGLSNDSASADNTTRAGSAPSWWSWGRWGMDGVKEEEDTDEEDEEETKVESVSSSTTDSVIDNATADGTATTTSEINADIHAGNHATDPKMDLGCQDTDYPSDDSQYESLFRDRDPIVISLNDMPGFSGDWVVSIPLSIENAGYIVRHYYNRVTKGIILNVPDSVCQWGINDTKKFFSITPDVELDTPALNHDPTIILLDAHDGNRDEEPGRIWLIWLKDPKQRKVTAHRVTLC